MLFRSDRIRIRFRYRQPRRCMSFKGMSSPFFRFLSVGASLVALASVSLAQNAALSDEQKAAVEAAAAQGNTAAVAAIANPAARISDDTAKTGRVPKRSASMPMKGWAKPQIRLCIAAAKLKATAVMPIAAIGAMNSPKLWRRPAVTVRNCMK